MDSLGVLIVSCYMVSLKRINGGCGWEQVYTDKVLHRIPYITRTEAIAAKEEMMRGVPERELSNYSFKFQTCAESL